MIYRFYFLKQWIHTAKAKSVNARAIMNQFIHSNLLMWKYKIRNGQGSLNLNFESEFDDLFFIVIASHL